MTIRKQRFTPEVLLSAPRRSAGVPNSNASHILYSVSTYSFEKHEKTSEIRTMDTKSGQSARLTDDPKCSNPVWINDETVALLRSTSDDTTEFLIGGLKDFKDSYHLAGTIDAPASNLKITELDDGTYGVAVSAAANPDGSLYSPSKAKKPNSTGRLYRSIWVRHWDKWIAPQRNAIWYAALSKSNDATTSASAPRLKLSGFINALHGSRLECPIPPFGGTDHFDISKTGLLFVSKDRNLVPAINTRCAAYIVPLTTFREVKPKIYEVLTPPLMQGAMASPVFSSDGSKAAFLMMRENGYESDQNEVLLIPDVRTPSWVVHLLNKDSETRHWNKSPSSMVFSHDGNWLYLTTEDNGAAQVFSLATDIKDQRDPLRITDLRWSVSDVQVLKPAASSAHRLFISGTSMVESSGYAVVTISYSSHSPMDFTATSEQVSMLSGDGSTFGLDYSQISDIRSPRAENTSEPPHGVHSWVVKPSDFDPKKKYPLAFLIHGGPQGAWVNSWSTRWNPAVFAEQGYVCVCPNPTGSTGYGQRFCDAIKEQWGGLPYEDLVKCFEYIEKELDYVDTDRAVALGGSYGGYMINWIQGHPLGRKFKALVCHDGIFNIPSTLSTEELYFPQREFNGIWSKNKENWLKWSPSEFTEHWKTPELVIHSEKDYRLAIAEGLAAFNVLQVQGVESELLTFPDENHWVLNPENSLVWHETVINFINKYVGLPTIGHDRGVIQDPQPLDSLEDRVLPCCPRD